MWDLLSEQLMEIHLQEMLHEAAVERLAREVSGPERRWLYRQRCRWLRRLGQLLVGLGQRLQQVGLPPAVAVEGRARTGR